MSMPLEEQEKYLGVERRVKRENLRRVWFKFKKSKLSLIGLGLVSLLLLFVVLAEFIAPYPEHAGLYINFKDAYKPPSMEHLFGTDMYGRDVLSRVIFGFRYAFLLIGIVLSLVVPTGVVLGLIAGYYRGTIVETIIIRLSDIFISIPYLVLALAIASILEPNIYNAMLAVSLMWWPWYVKLTHSVTASLRNEPFILAAEAQGASTLYILFRELLPNQLGIILTKVTLDAGWVVLIGAAISFVGLGAQPPTPDLGTMVSEYSKYLPNYWWMSMGPALGIILIILSFNLLGDGIRDVFAGD
ncbi:putative D,D-dipeptide transport system permease protein DdpC [Candidatus Calditenuaceae archaeon HR02]|nr:putative D,D-dipeptide transport system permease protein DdpC [Candidatus Calditenuaceae archaeon HR02]